MCIKLILNISKTEKSKIKIVSTPKYNIKSEIISYTKTGENISGDSYLQLELQDLRQLSVISDGVGSGESAARSSSTVINMLERLLSGGFDEDKAIMLSNDKFAAANPFEYQKANRLVYCNLLEHLLLHVKIAENPNAQANENELPGIGGAINFICKDLNDIYAGKEFTDDWRKTVAEKVKDNFTQS